jgi:predicted RNA methylase
MKFNSFNENKKCNKLDLDKYYTSYEDMEYCVNKAWDVISELGYSVSEFLEPSAGNGVFSNYLATSGLDVIAIDIEPENENIIKANFLTYELEYKKNRFIIGNPPYGSRLKLAKEFYKKAIQLGDYIAFILPISQLNNKNSMYEFDLVYSEDLGVLTFSGLRNIHCCLNVYIRPKDGLNKLKRDKLKDVEIVRQDSKKYKDFEFDIRMCYWGDATAGKILSEDEHYSAEYKIKIYNKAIKDDVINVLSNINWHDEINSTAMLKIQQFHIINVLKKYIPNIK